MTVVTNPRLTLRPVDPAADSALLHAWVTQERARFWGMLDKSVDEVEEIYSYIRDQPHLAAYLVSWDDVPWALFQTYDPAVDEIGGFYDRRPGDLGVHLFIGPGKRPQGFSAALFPHLSAHVFADPAVQRVVMEPDVENQKSRAVLDRLGTELGPQADLPGKRAQFAFITRDDWAAGL